MDNQQNSKLSSLLLSQLLPQLYNEFVENPQLTLTNLEQKFELERTNILALIAELKQMGLEISQNQNIFQCDNAIDKLDVDAIKQQLTDQNIALPLNYFFMLASTNGYAIKTKQAGIYLCEYQTQGHGKQARKWHAPIGQAITLSICYEFSTQYTQLQGLNIAIAVAIINTAKKFGQNQLQLKWSNDVFLQNHKVAGILINIQGKNNYKNNKFITIGIGINWQLSQLALKAIEQKSANIDIKNTTRTQFIAQLIIEVDKIIHEFRQNQLTNIINIWNQHDMCQNKKVTVNQAGKTWQSKYLGINHDGQAMVENIKDGKIDKYLLASGSISL